ncbi:MAG: ABC transporter permease [Betaproteobacteria bacterium]|nr:ABC transporter permease [Betaproteobacteria bacterium]
MLQGYLPSLLDGTLATLGVGLVSLCIAVVLGLIGAAAKLSRAPSARHAANAYTTLIRGVPDLVLMLLIFFGGKWLLDKLFAVFGWGHADLSPFVAGCLTLGLIFGAYLTETFRGALMAIPPGQREAGLAYGMSALQVAWRITGPQMIRFALPGFTNNWLVLVKSTALVSVIGLTDMMHRAGSAAGTTQDPFTFYVAAGAIYLAITSVSLVVLKALERRMSIGVRKAA